MSLVFVSPLFEFFTPTDKSSTALVETDLCHIAQENGVKIFVTARSGSQQAHNWLHMITANYPAYQKCDPRHWLLRGQRKYFGGANVGDYAFVGRLAQVIAARKFDQFPLIVHSNPVPAIWLRQKFPRAFIVFWGHGVRFSNAQVRRQLKSTVDLAIGVSDFQCRWMQSFYGLQPEQTATVYNSVDLKFFSPAPSSARNSRDVMTITYVGNIRHKKGLDILLSAALKIAPAARNFRIQIIGSPARIAPEIAARYERELRELERRLAARGVMLEWLGHVEHQRIPDLLRQSDIHVVPTRCDEAFGLSTLEAMACGVATIASKTGGTPEVVGDAALLFEREDTEQLARRMHDLMEDESLRLEYSQRGRERARQFTAELAWRRLQEILTKTTGGIT